MAYCKCSREGRKKHIQDSTKGHAGGYSINKKTLNTPIIELLNLIEREETFKLCVIGFKKCNENNPCPLHNQIVGAREQMLKIFSETKIGDLLKKDKNTLIKSLITDYS